MFSDVGKVWVGTTNEILGAVPERPISANPGLKFCSVFVLTFLYNYVLLRVTFCLIITISWSEGSTVFCKLE